MRTISIRYTDNILGCSLVLQDILCITANDVSWRVVLTNNVMAPIVQRAVLNGTSHFCRSLPNNLSKMVVLVGSLVVVCLSLVVPSGDSRRSIFETTSKILTKLTMRVSQHSGTVVRVGVVFSIFVGQGVPR